jgi:DNA primase
MPNAAGAVLPVLDGGHAVYAQIRVVGTGSEGLRYLNPKSGLATNPRLSFYCPAEDDHPEVIVTEGAIDALSVCAAGFDAVAILSASYPDRAIALQLTRVRGPLVVAFDADEAGRSGAERLTSLLEVHGRRPAQLALRDGDLNEALVRSSNWRRELRLRVDDALSPRRSDLGRGLA